MPYRIRERIRQNTKKTRLNDNNTAVLINIIKQARHYRSYYNNNYIRNTSHSTAQIRRAYGIITSLHLSLFFFYNSQQSYIPYLIENCSQPLQLRMRKKTVSEVSPKHAGSAVRFASEASNVPLSPPPTQTSLPFGAGVQFSCESIRLFKNKIRGNTEVFEQSISDLHPNVPVAWISECMHENKKFSVEVHFK